MKKNYFDRVSTKEVTSVEGRSLNIAFGEIESDWETVLKNAGMKLPAKNTSKRYQLSVLKHFQGKAVHKDDIAELIKKLTGKAATDQQIRHLKTQGGWFVLNRGDCLNIDGEQYFNPEGCHVLITTKTPFPRSTFQRRESVSKGDWEEILKEYDYACASCGTKIGEHHRFDSALKVATLEKGHMNPNKPLVPGNIIPQCRWCNKTARGDFTFDEQGRPRAIASVRPVRRADDKVISEVKEWILNRKEKKSQK